MDDKQLAVNDDRSVLVDLANAMRELALEVESDNRAVLMDALEDAREKITLALELIGGDAVKRRG